MRKHHTKHYSESKNYPNLLAIVTLLLSTSLFSSCSDDDNDNWVKTKVEGRPSKIVSSERGSIYFYYQSDKLVKIKEDEGSTSNFKYKGDELIEVTYSPTDKNVADGNGSTTFSREGNIITVKSSGEPSFYTYTREIELGDNGLPLKISDKGLKEPGPDGKDLTIVAPTYILYTYDDSGKNLIEKRIYDAQTNQLKTTQTYNYDSKYGAASKNGLPRWYNIYIENQYTYRFIYLNYANNLTKIEFINNIDNYTVPTTFTYKYADNGYPLSIVSNIKDADEGSPSYIIEY